MLAASTEQKIPTPPANKFGLAGNDRLDPVIPMSCYHAIQIVKKERTTIDVTTSLCSDFLKLASKQTKSKSICNV